MNDLVVVTRPEPEASQLVDWLAKHQIKAMALPLLTCQALKPKAQAEQLAMMQSWIMHKPLVDAVIFISKRSVRYGLPCLDETMRTSPMFAIGQATAQALMDEGIESSFAHQFDSEHLLELLKQQATSWQGKRVLLVKGLGGRTHLREGLLALGADVHEFCCYQRLPTESLDFQPLWQAHNVKNNIWLLLTSGAALDNLVRLSTAMLREVCSVWVLSPRLEAMARRHGFRQVEVLSMPIPEHILQRLQTQQN